MKRILFIGISLIFSAGLLAQNVGQIAPDFNLKSLNNNNYTLSQNRDDVIVVFFVGYNCPLCLASAPTVKSDLFDVYNGNSDLQLLIIDTWDGSYSAFLNFKNVTNLPGIYLQKGSGVLQDWSADYDKLVVIDTEGKMVFKGTNKASSDVDAAKQAVQNALSVATSVNNLYLKDGFWAKQIYPNPFSERTRIEFNLPESELISLSVVDLTGKEVLKRTGKIYPAGRSSITLNRNNLAEGIYLYRLEAGSHFYTGKMIVR